MALRDGLEQRERVSIWIWETGLLSAQSSGDTGINIFFNLFLGGVGNFKSVHPCCWSSGSSAGWGQGRSGLLPPAFRTGLAPETSAAQRRHLAQADQVPAWRPPGRSQTNRACFVVALLGQGLAIARWRHGCGRLGDEYPHPSSPGRVIAGELKAQSQAQQGGWLGRGGIDVDWQQGHLIDNLASCSNQGAWASTTGSRPAIASL